MIKHSHSSSPKSRFRQVLLASASAAVLLAAVPQQAQALTLLLNFTAAPVTENWAPSPPYVPSTIGAADFSGWGFTGLTTSAMIQSAVLAAVTKDYLMYPTVGVNALSPLPVGKELDINFEIVTSGTTLPSNGDPSYFYFGVGSTTGGGETEYGHACLSCVKGGPFFAPNGTMVGVNFTDNLFGLVGLASTDAERVNILAGTISHEFGHSLSLLHPSGPLLNPGASSYTIMGTGASPTFMPSSNRILDRAFAYSEFSTLISAVGLRDVSPIPEPGTYAMLLLGLGVVVSVRKRQTAQA